MASRGAGPKSLLKMYVGLMGGLGLLYGFSPLLGSSGIGNVIAGLAVLASLGALLEQISKRGFKGALVRIAGFGLLSFGCMFGLVWFFTGYLANQPGLFTIKASGSIAAEATARVALPSPTATPLILPTNTVPAIAAATPSPVASPTPLLVASVFNGGNLREQPGLRGRVLDQVNAGERVELQAKNVEGTWNQVVNLRGKQGWVSATLLTIAPETSLVVPVVQ